MRILYISQYFPPEAGATQTRAFENARYLAGAGHDVTVVCEIPNHPAGVVFEGYRRCLYKIRRVQGIQVIHVRGFTAARKNFLTRLGFYFSFTAGACLAGAAIRVLAGRTFDVIYATSPPLPAAGAGLLLARAWDVPLFFEVRDLWPDSAVALGELTRPAAVKLAAGLERACYQRAVKVVAVTRGIADTLLTHKQVPARKVALVPNGATTDRFFHDAAAGDRVRQHLGLVDHFVVLYAGILGIAQGLETMVAAARQLTQTHPKICFLVAGAGPRKAALETMARRAGCGNIRFLGEFPRERMPALYAASDAALVPLIRHPIFTRARPSKLFDAWACEVPVLLGIEGEAAALLAQCGGGLCYTPQDAAALAEAVLSLTRLPWTQRRKMGKTARAFVKTHHSRLVYARHLEQILRQTVSCRNRS
jgi:colanic acid biosynthesis glycosyl transferase WcaI